VFSLAFSITQYFRLSTRPDADADSVRRDWPEGRRRAKCPSVLRTSGLAATGLIPPDLARAVCGNCGCSCAAGTSHDYAADP
jgi:hypothetical protein